MADETGEAGRGAAEKAASSRPSSSAPAPDLGELERARAHLAAIVDSSEDGIIGKTLDGIVVSWNKGAEQLFGYTSQEMVGQPITTIIPPEFHYEETEILAKIRRGERIERYHAIRIHKEGRRLNISLTVSPVRDMSGKIVGAAKIAHDVTENERAQKALERELEARTAVEEALRLSEAQLKQVVMEREHLLQS
ncbi:MAG: hypothetical protein JWO52_8005, partial [Gammaproteobacteria bacterium]|nr:hypothetical protein [Gammaproteobacteria bacterium]